ncbi:hypothetical protein BKA70DRAFT_1120832 [Coprinopsis sp. MPI-PUGE-AT-0042]|nr:hypothetical protein BKA70DRAFT_1120832 [Coprinopsis sp. MPI-PUGE-AT-0042]
MVQAAKASLKSGTKAQYYPLSPPESAKYNPKRPTYDLANLPRRNQITYWETLNKLSAPGLSKAQQALISKTTGVAHIPLCIASLAFLHPSFFPLDPFHLFYENCMPFLWDLWIGSDSKDPIHIPSAKIQAFGELVSSAFKTLPPSFCGPIRNTDLKRQSQYKAYEWMALLHWYILPIGLELEFSLSILRNFSYFAEAVDIAMKIGAHSKASLTSLQETINTFLEDYEFLYVGNTPEKVTQSRLCIFQLVHVPHHILWYGSIRNSSQATVECEIGVAEHQIHSKRDVFENLMSIIIEKEMLHILQLYHPNLSPDAARAGLEVQLSDTQRKFTSEVAIRQINWPHLEKHISAIERCLQHLDPNYSSDHKDIQRFGKLRLGTPKQTLRSQLSEVHQRDGYNQTRCYRWFEVSIYSMCSSATTSILRPETAGHRFAEALAFYSVNNGYKTHQVVVYMPLLKLETPLKTVIRGCWPPSSTLPLFAMEVLAIQHIIGIWEAPKSSWVYVLRKHPGLDLLDPPQCGLSSAIEEEMDDDDELEH